jgi:dipeptide/tripeptide permease
MAEQPQGGAVSRAIRSYFREFGTLRKCSRQFWVVQLVNLLDGVAYFGMLTVSTLYLSETLGFSDSKAAYLWGACMAVYTATGFIAGFIGDSLGIKRTLYLSVILLVVSRLVVGFTEAKAAVIPALFVIAIGTAIMTPILISATKRYTTKESQTAGFNLLYFLMNIGAFLGNFTIDPLRSLEYGNRAVFMLGSAMSILCWLSILLFWRKGIDSVDAQQKKINGENGKTEWEPPWKIAAEVFRESAFWRFMLFLVILVGVRLVFEHQYQVYPKYYQRTMAKYLVAAPVELAGTLDEARLPDELVVALAELDIPLPTDVEVIVNEANQRWRIELPDQSYYVRNDGDQISVYASDPPIGLLNSINPFIICIGVIISTPIVARYKLFNVMFVGIVYSASSMLLLVVYPGWFCGWLGISINEGYVVIAILQICLFSLGEVIWSPRLYEYTAAIAPPGREASYMGLSYLPMFFARFAEGPLAGALLTRYCPPDVGARLETTPYTESPQFMNLILAGLALATPILILVFRGVIQKESRIEQNTAADPPAGG